MSPASRAHARQHASRQRGEAEEVGLEHRADLLVLAFLDGREIAVARVVDEDVDTAACGFGELHDALAAFGIGDIERGDVRCLRKPLRELRDRAFVARRDDAAVAAVEDTPCKLAAKARGAAGDEPGFRAF